MTRAELNGGIWTIPAGRMKAKMEHVIPLSAKAKAVLADLPAIGTTYVFSTNGRTPIGGFGYFKTAFDRRSGVKGWTLHDLRRTARSLLSRAGVEADVAERCLAHTIGGVRGTYDGHRYIDEKARAFEALAAMIERILNPSAENVVSLRGPPIPA
jgi:integrase